MSLCLLQSRLEKNVCGCPDLHYFTVQYHPHIYSCYMGRLNLLISVPVSVSVPMPVVVFVFVFVLCSCSLWCSFSCCSLSAFALFDVLAFVDMISYAIHCSSTCYILVCLSCTVQSTPYISIISRKYK